MNKNHVKVLAREMIHGRWKSNGDTICLNENQIIDGQHRLLAVIESGVTIEALLVSGLDSDVFDTKDVGKRRSAADTLAVKGEMSCKSLAACLAVIDRYMTGRISKSVKYTNTEVEEVLEKYPEARRSVRLCMETKRLLPNAILAGCHYLFAQKNQEQADQFVRDLRSGVGLEDGDPVYVLRERLMQNNIAKAKLGKFYLMAIVIKAWNYRRDRKNIRFLRWREEGDNPEPFPVVI